MSKQEHTDATRARKAALERRIMAAWAKQIRTAENAWAAEKDHLCAGSDIPKSEIGTELQNTAVYLTHWLARVFNDGQVVSPVEAAIIRRLRAAVQPMLAGQKVALAHALVDGMGNKYRSGSGDAVATELVVLLRQLVHPAFDALKASDTGGFLDRYEATKARRTTTGKGRGKLSAAGILCELNRLARWPLGRALTARQVANAVKRYGEHVTPEVT